MKNNKEIRAARQKILLDAKEKLKKEFIGLDEIIDEIIRLVSPWFITPEVMKRPTIISLWGMTGTGKSSVVRRLIDLLGYTGRAAFFDCGTEVADDRLGNIAEKVNDLLGIDNDTYNISKNQSNANDLIFVFDEFQYARTISQDGEELNKPSLRVIWQLIDTGILDLGKDRYSWDVYRFFSWIDDISSFVEDHGNIKLVENMINNRSDVKLLIDDVGFFLYDRATNLIAPELGLDKDDCKYRDPYSPLAFIKDDYFSVTVKQLNKIEKGLGKKYLNKLRNAQTISESYDICIDIKKRLTGADISIDCSGSLVFVIGNLDEAFKVEGEINPDFDADIFHDITQKVTITDIKDALKSKFRAEQIARIGNNLIKYPTLNKSSFEKIIKLEVSRILNDFNSVTGLSVSLEPSIYALLYNEGVFPVQGVRPIFTTISGIVSPILSKVVCHDSNAVLGLKNEDDFSVKDFKIGKTTILIKYEDSIVEEYDYKLSLGVLRDPTNRKTRYISSVHEAGHAIVMSSVTGELPTKIVSVSSDKGGFCDTYLSSKEGEIRTKKDVDNNIAISLGGYEAERLIFSDRPEMCLMGSSNDVEDCWNDFLNNAYSVGYFEPVSFENYNIKTSGDGIPSGISDDFYVHVNPGLSHPLPKACKYVFDNIREETKIILKKEIKLLKETALVLGKKGSIDSNEFLELIKKYGNELSEESMKKTRELYSEKYYLDCLK